MNIENYCYRCGCPISWEQADEYDDHCSDECYCESMGLGYNTFDNYDTYDNDENYDGDDYDRSMRYVFDAGYDPIYGTERIDEY